VIFKHVESPEIPNLKTKNIDGKRHYVVAEGKYYPSVTTVTGLLSAKGIADWRKRVGNTEANRISGIASRRGTAIHTICERYLDNENYLDGVMPSNVETFESIRPILDDFINNIHSQEVALYSDHLRLAGRCDLIAEFDGKLSVIDFKTSRKPKRHEWCHGYFIQECAYSIMWEERTGIPITNLVTIMAVDDSPPKVFVEHRDTWSSALLELIEKYYRRE
tara:strand:+ start:33865 stop:34524 length:660 start_codon:yes stop_codon:yes gene_type:complete